MTDDNKLESIIFGLKETIAEKDKEIERLTDTLNQYISGELVNEDVFAEQVKDIQQAVKDTAKEIYTMVRGYKYRLIRSQERAGWDRAIDIACKEIKERYGVEVE